MKTWIDGQSVKLAPFCTSQRCSPGGWKQLGGNGKQMRKDEARVVRDICQDCGYYVTWLPEIPPRTKNFVCHITRLDKRYRFPG